MKKYKAAIVGCGRIASLFAEDKKRRGLVTHAQAYRAHPDTELVAACDLEADRLSAFGKKWGVRRLYTDFDKMMRLEKPELVSICTWNSSHEALVRKALRGGARSIICEKPISDTLKSAERMIRHCDKKEVPLLVNYSRRYNRTHHEVKKMIQRGDLGRIQTVSCYYTAGIMNTGTHLFDILMFFFGDVEWVWSNPDRVLEAPDPTFDVYLFFKKGFGCAVSALDVKHYMQFEMDIYGTKGRLRIEDSGMRIQVWRIVDHKMYGGYKTLQREKVLTADFSDNLYVLVDNSIHAIHGDQKPFCSGEDAKKALEVACAAHESLKKGRRIKLPLKNKSMKLVSK